MSNLGGNKQGRELGKLLKGEGLELNRRDFLTLTGFSFVAMTGAVYAGERKVLGRSPLLQQSNTALIRNPSARSMVQILGVMVGLHHFPLVWIFRHHRTTCGLLHR